MKPSQITAGTPIVNIWLKLILVYGWVAILLIEFFVPPGYLGLESFTFLEYYIPLIVIGTVLSSIGIILTRGRDRFWARIGLYAFLSMQIIGYFLIAAIFASI